jgi:hypothetical protein
MFKKIRNLSNWNKFYILLIIVFFVGFVLPILIFIIEFLLGKSGVKVL